MSIITSQAHKNFELACDAILLIDQDELTLGHMKNLFSFYLTTYVPNIKSAILECRFLGEDKIQFLLKGGVTSDGYGVLLQTEYHRTNNKWIIDGKS